MWYDRRKNYHKLVNFLVNGFLYLSSSVSANAQLPFRYKNQQHSLSITYISEKNMFNCPNLSEYILDICSMFNELKICLCMYVVSI